MAHEEKSGKKEVDFKKGGVFYHFKKREKAELLIGEAEKFKWDYLYNNSSVKLRDRMFEDVQTYEYVQNKCTQYD